MDMYIGLDAHSSSCTVAVIGPIRAIPGTRHLCLEEGTHSNRLYEALSPHVQEISDKIDAFG